MSRIRLLILLLLTALAVFGQDTFAIKDGDTVVFYGDSITDQRLYTTFAETYVLTRFPQRTVNFVHSGWGGDRVTGGGGGPIDVRLQRDVIAYRPTVMTIMLGMNDGRYRAFDPDIFNVYKTGYVHILDTVKQALPNVRFTLIEPSPYDDVTRPPTFPGGYNAVLLQYSDFLKQLGDQRQAAVADLNRPVVAMLRRANEIDPQLAQKILPDRVHPGASGHLIMAEALLRSWNAPSTVTNVVIDVPASRVVTQESTAVTDLKTGETIAWTQKDRALPMPVDMNDATTALAVRASDFVAALNQEMLRVNGLPGARYQLKINGQAVGTFTKEQLADGINLATMATPMMKQAADVHALTLKHSGIHNTRWRTLQVPLANDPVPHLAAAMEQLDLVEADLVKAQRTAAQPQPASYELIPQ